MKADILEELKKHFRPEFLNRIDKTIVFRALTHQNIREIVRIHINKLQKRIEDKHLVLEITDSALDRLAELGFDPEYGARPVRRKIQELVEDQLTEGLLNDKFVEGDTIVIDRKDDLIELSKKTLIKKVAKTKKV